MKHNPAPTSLATILDPTWLADMVYPAFPHADIAGTQIVWSLATTATKARVRVQPRESVPSGMETRICVKGMLDEVGAPFVPGVSTTEARFYQDLAEPLAAGGLNTPACLYAGIDPANMHGLVIMRDLVSADGAEFLSALTPYSAQDARLSLGQLARLHALTGRDTALYRLEWNVRTIERIAAKSMIPLDMLQDLLDGPRSGPLPAGIADAGRLHRAIGALSACFAQEPSCLIHGDAHAGNIYRIGDSAGIIDWQLVQQGHWAQDVAYHLCAALSPEDRRDHERDLLDHYLAQREVLDGTTIDREHAWRCYRMAVVYGYYLWAITRRVEPSIILEFNRRLGLAVAELGSYELLGV